MASRRQSLASLNSTGSGPTPFQQQANNNRPSTTSNNRTTSSRNKPRSTSSRGEMALFGSSSTTNINNRRASLASASGAATSRRPNNNNTNSNSSILRPTSGSRNTNHHLARSTNLNNLSTSSYPMKSPFVNQSGLQTPFSNFTFGDALLAPPGAGGVSPDQNLQQQQQQVSMMMNNSTTNTGNKSSSSPNTQQQTTLSPVNNSVTSASTILLQPGSFQQRRNSQFQNGVLLSPGSEGLQNNNNNNNNNVSFSILQQQQQLGQTPQTHSLHQSTTTIHHPLEKTTFNVLGASTALGGNVSPANNIVSSSSAASPAAKQQLPIPSAVSLFANFSKGILLERGIAPVFSDENVKAVRSAAAAKANKAKEKASRFSAFTSSSPSTRRKKKEKAAEKTRQLISIWFRISFTNYVIFRLLRPVQRLRAHNAILARDNFAAFIVQCAWRRVQQRERLRKYHAVKTISERFSRVLRFAFERKRRAATSMQKVIRGFLARRAFKKMRYEAFQASLRKCIRRKLWRLRRHRGKDFRKMLIDERNLLLDEFIRVYHQIARAEFQEYYDVTTTDSAAVFNRHAKMVRDRSTISDGIMNKDYEQLSEDIFRRRREKEELERIKREIEELQKLGSFSARRSYNNDSGGGGSENNNYDQDDFETPPRAPLNPEELVGENNNNNNNSSSRSRRNKSGNSKNRDDLDDDDGYDSDDEHNDNSDYNNDERSPVAKEESDQLMHTARGPDALIALAQTGVDDMAVTTNSNSMSNSHSNNATPTTNDNNNSFAAQTAVSTTASEERLLSTSDNNNNQSNNNDEEDENEEERQQRSERIASQTLPFGFKPPQTLLDQLKIEDDEEDANNDGAPLSRDQTQALFSPNSGTTSASATTPTGSSVQKSSSQTYLVPPSRKDKKKNKYQNHSRHSSNLSQTSGASSFDDSNSNNNNNNDAKRHHKNKKSSNNASLSPSSAGAAMMMNLGGNDEDADGFSFVHSTAGSVSSQQQSPNVKAINNNDMMVNSSSSNANPNMNSNNNLLDINNNNNSNSGDGSGKLSFHHRPHSWAKQQIQLQLLREKEIQDEKDREENERKKRQLEKEMELKPESQQIDVGDFISSALKGIGWLTHHAKLQVEQELLLTQQQQQQQQQSLLLSSPPSPSSKIATTPNSPILGPSSSTATKQDSSGTPSGLLLQKVHSNITTSQLSNHSGGGHHHHHHHQDLETPTSQTPSRQRGALVSPLSPLETAAVSHQQSHNNSITNTPKPQHPRSPASLLHHASSIVSGNNNKSNPENSIANSEFDLTCGPGSMVLGTSSLLKLQQQLSRSDLSAGLTSPGAKKSLQRLQQQQHPPMPVPASPNSLVGGVASPGVNILPTGAAGSFSDRLPDDANNHNKDSSSNENNNNNNNKKPEEEEENLAMFDPASTTSGATSSPIVNDNNSNSIPQQQQQQQTPQQHGFSVREQREQQQLFALQLQQSGFTGSLSASDFAHPSNINAIRQRASSVYSIGANSDFQIPEMNQSTTSELVLPFPGGDPSSLQQQQFGSSMNRGGSSGVQSSMSIRGRYLALFMAGGGADLELTDPVLMAYGDLIERAEALTRKALLQQHRHATTELHEHCRWGVAILHEKSKVPHYFHSLIMKLYPDWSVKLGSQLIQDELNGREQIMSLYAHLPLRPPWQQRTFGGTSTGLAFVLPHCSAVPPAIEAPPGEQDGGFVENYGTAQDLSLLSGLVVRNREGKTITMDRSPPSSGDDEDDDGDSDNSGEDDEEDEEDDDFEQVIFDERGNVVLASSGSAYHHHRHHGGSMKNKASSSGAYSSSSNTTMMGNSHLHQHSTRSASGVHGKGGGGVRVIGGAQSVRGVGGSQSARGGGRAAAATIEELEDIEHEQRTKRRKEARDNNSQKQELGVLHLEDAEERRNRMMRSAMDSEELGLARRPTKPNSQNQSRRRKHRASVFSTLSQRAANVSESELRDLQEGLHGGGLESNVPSSSSHHHQQQQHARPPGGKKQQATTTFRRKIKLPISSDQKAPVSVLKSKQQEEDNNNNNTGSDEKPEGGKRKKRAVQFV